MPPELKFHQTFSQNKLKKGLRHYYLANGIEFSDENFELKFQNLIEKVKENEAVTTDKKDFTKAVKLLIRLNKQEKLQKLTKDEKDLIDKFIKELNTPLQSQRYFIPKANQFLAKYGLPSEQRLGENGVCSGLGSVICEYYSNGQIEQYQELYNTILNYQPNQNLDEENIEKLLGFLRNIVAQHNQQFSANRRNSGDDSTQYEKTETFYIRAWKNNDYKKMLENLFEKDSDGNYVEKCYRFACNGHTTTVIVRKHSPFTYISTNNKKSPLQIKSIRKLARAIRQAQFEDLITLIDNPYRAQLIMNVDVYPKFYSPYDVTESQLRFNILLEFIKKMDSYYTQDQLHQYNMGTISADVLFGKVLNYIIQEKNHTKVNNVDICDFERKYIEYLTLDKELNKLIVILEKHKEKRISSVARNNEMPPLAILFTIKEVIETLENSKENIDENNEILMKINDLLDKILFSNSNVDNISSKPLPFKDKAEAFYQAVRRGSLLRVLYQLDDKDFHTDWMNNQHNGKWNFFSVAIENEQIEVARLLLTNNFLHSKNRGKELGDYIKLLKKRGFKEEIKFLVENKNTYTNAIKEHEIHNLFFNACENADIELIEILLEYKDCNKIDFNNAGPISIIKNVSFIAYALSKEPVDEKLIELLYKNWIDATDDDFNDIDNDGNEVVNEAKREKYNEIISKIDRSKINHYKTNENNRPRSTMLPPRTSERSSASDSSPNASPRKQKRKLSNKDNTSFFEKHKYKILVGALIVAALLIGTGVAGLAGVGILSIALGSIMPLKFAALSPTVVPFLEGIACAALTGLAAATAYGVKKLNHWLSDQGSKAKGSAVSTQSFSSSRRSSEVETPSVATPSSLSRSNSLSDILTELGSSSGEAYRKSIDSDRLLTSFPSPTSGRNSPAPATSATPFQLPIASMNPGKLDGDSSEENSTGAK